MIMKYLVEVSKIPSPQVHYIRKEYEVILTEFFNANIKQAKVHQSLIPYKTPTKIDLKIMQGLRRAVLRLRLPIKVVTRKNEVYLIRIITEELGRDSDNSIGGRIV